MSIQEMVQALYNKEIGGVTGDKLYNFVLYKTLTVSQEVNYYGQYSHRYTVEITGIPNILEMTLDQDFYYRINNITTGQDPDSNMALGVSLNDYTNGILHFKSSNFVKAISISVYYNELFKNAQ